jgi:hypothetical protein
MGTTLSPEYLLGWYKLPILWRGEMEYSEKERLRNIIGSLPIINDGRATDDNVAIAIGTYFEGLPECPENDFNDEIGWSQWAVDQTNDALDRIVDALRRAVEEK